MTLVLDLVKTEEPFITETIVQLAATPQPDFATAIDDACKRIAPLWPLKNFVAVNPFVGTFGAHFRGRLFAGAARDAQRDVDAASVLPPAVGRRTYHPDRFGTRTGTGTPDIAGSTCPRC
jgi:hypothetical protein